MATAKLIRSRRVNLHARRFAGFESARSPVALGCDSGKMQDYYRAGWDSARAKGFGCRERVSVARAHQDAQDVPEHQRDGGEER
jgi:hypothetical protein